MSILQYNILLTIYECRKLNYKLLKVQEIIQVTAIIFLIIAPIINIEPIDIIRKSKLSIITVVE